jgi:sodium-dependent phosphate cotransporter
MRFQGNLKSIVRILLFIAVLYLFFVSLELMGGAFKLFGKPLARQLMETTQNPLVGLMIGILATSLVQSSSVTTVTIVQLVGNGTLTVANAIPMVMGANIGTTVTNTLVSIGHIGRPKEFSRALAGATVHDFFNMLSVAVFLPLEMTTHFIGRVAEGLSHLFDEAGGFEFISPLKALVKPTAKLIQNLLAGIIDPSHWALALVQLILALIFLFFALKNMVGLMKKLIIGKVENLLHNYLFNSALASFLLGLALTSVIQSSSATTSLIVPVVGAGILSIHQIFPYVLGTNVGTTVTALLSSLVAKEPAGLTVALAHLTFNLSGSIVWYPLRKIPITIALRFGEFTGRHRPLAIAYMVVGFFLIPILIILLFKGSL